MPSFALDNDVLLKSVCYGFLGDVLAVLPGGPHSPGILGTARFVLPKALKKRVIARAADAEIELQQALAAMEILEPDDQEVHLAAELELAAQKAGLPVHAGECQLIAILAIRCLSFLLTGDRSAIGSLWSLDLPSSLPRQALHGKLLCFEQVIKHLMVSKGATWVRSAVCAEPQVDTALRLCFSCSSPSIPESSWFEGIESQIADLKRSSGFLLSEY